MLGLRGRLGRWDLGDNGQEPEINMAPLIDMVFILLIFFLVTTSFVREAGVEVKRPQAASAVARTGASLLVAVEQNGHIYIEGRRVGLAGVRSLVERYLAENPKGGVVIVADRASRTGRVIQVLDQCKLAGAREVAVAARRPES